MGGEWEAVGCPTLYPAWGIQQQHLNLLSVSTHWVSVARCLLLLCLVFLILPRGAPVTALNCFGREGKC